MSVNQQQDDINRDLGIGSRVAQESHVRFLNRDGSFNVRRKGLSFFRSQNTYHSLLTMSWVKFFIIVIISYFVVNAIFAFGYVLCGSDAIDGIHPQSVADAFLQDFFFSVQTIATIGYGAANPHGLSLWHWH